MDLAELKKEHPELVQAIKQEALDASPLRSLEEKSRTLEAEKVTLTEANTAAKREADEAKAKAQTLETEKQALQAKLDVYVTKEAEAAHKASIDSKLAECVKKGTLKTEQISDKFKELLYGIQDVAKVDVLIAEREEAFGTPGVKGNGPRAEGGNKDKPKMTADQFVAGVKARK